MRWVNKNLVLILLLAGSELLAQGSNGDEFTFVRVRYKSGGVNFRLSERYDMAIAALRKAIYITPFDSGIHQKLAQAYLSKKQYDDAIDELQVTLLTEPQDLAGAHCDLANAYLQAGRKAEAKNAALAALEIAPNYDRAQEILLASIE